MAADRLPGPCCRWDIPFRRRRIHRDVGAHSDRELAPPRRILGSDDGCDVAGFEACDHGEPDRAGADDQSGLATAQGGLVHRVIADRHRLGQRRQPRGRARRYGHGDGEADDREDDDEAERPVEKAERRERDLGNLEKHEYRDRIAHHDLHDPSSP